MIHDDTVLRQTCTLTELPPSTSPPPVTNSIVRGRTYPEIMTHNVLHRGYGITIDLSASDLGNPDHPGLLQEIHRNYKPDLLYCLGAHEYGTVCPGFMTIAEKNGRYHARHVTRGVVPETAGESELHKASRPADGLHSLHHGSEGRYHPLTLSVRQ